MEDEPQHDGMHPFMKSALEGFHQLPWPRKPLSDKSKSGKSKPTSRGRTNRSPKLRKHFGY